MSVSISDCNYLSVDFYDSSYDRISVVVDNRACKIIIGRLL